MPFTVVQGPEGKPIPDALAGQFRKRTVSGLSLPNDYELDPTDPGTSAGCILPAPELELGDDVLHFTAIGADIERRRGTHDERAINDIAPRLLEEAHDLVDAHRELEWVDNPRVLLAIGNRPMEFSDTSPGGEEVEPWWIPAHEKTVIARCFWAPYFEGVAHAAGITPEFINPPDSSEESGMVTFHGTLRSIGETLVEGAEVVVINYFADTSTGGNQQRQNRQDNAATVTVSWGLSDAIRDPNTRMNFHAQTVVEGGAELEGQLGNQSLPVTVFSTVEQGVAYRTQHAGWTGNPYGDPFEPKAP